MRDQKKAEQIAENRVQLLSPLLAEGLDPAKAREIKTRICEQTGISERTLRRYLAQYRNSGFSGLKPKSRGKQITEDAIPSHILEQAILLRRQVPGRSISQLIQILEWEGLVQNGPYIQTFMFPGMQFMVGRLHFEKTCESMPSALNHYQNQLGDTLFSRLFKLLLTDRGSEFEKANLFEQGVDGKQRLNIFYCDAMQSAQKPHVENNHNFVRDIIPNGKPLDRLTQDSVNLMFSHINSTPRKALHGKTPYELFTFYFGNCVAETLGIIEIQKDDVILKPSLIF